MRVAARVRRVDALVAGRACGGERPGRNVEAAALVALRVGRRRAARRRDRADRIPHVPGRHNEAVVFSGRDARCRLDTARGRTVGINRGINEGAGCARDPHHVPFGDRRRVREGVVATLTRGCLDPGVMTLGPRVAFGDADRRVGECRPPRRRCHRDGRRATRGEKCKQNITIRDTRRCG